MKFAGIGLAHIKGITLKKIFSFWARKPGGKWFTVSEEDAQYIHAMERDFATEASLSEHKFHLQPGAAYRWQSRFEYKVIREK